MSKASKQEIPKRFQASKGVLLMDAFMTVFIKAGGWLVIVAVVGIFAFILSQILPLFQGASVEAIEKKNVPDLPAGEYVDIASDEWAELPLAIRKDGTVFFVDLEGGRGLIEKPPDWLGEEELSAIELNPEAGLITAGTKGGKFFLLNYSYDPEFEDGKRTIVESLKTEFSGELTEGQAIEQITATQSDNVRLIAGVVVGGSGQKVMIESLKRKKSLMGAGKWVAADRIELDLKLGAGRKIDQILATNRGDGIVITDSAGKVSYFFREGKGFVLRQEFSPFEDLQDSKVANAGFLFGDVSLVFTAVDGSNRIFSLLRTEEDPVRKFHHTKSLKTLGAAPDYFAKSLRNKAYLLGEGDRASLRFATSEEIRWSGKLPWQAQLGIIDGKYRSLLFLDVEGGFHKFDLNDPHPEAGMKAFFGKVWYEGASEPKYEWQSTGGSDDFEPKLSLVPLIFGSVKGTVYAMLFSVPIALFGAMYTSEFLDAKHKILIKPVMEIMASLPSVVLGFLAALWLAPLIENKVPSILMLVILVPLGSVLVGALWARQPMSIRKFIPNGLEFLYFTPVLLILGWVGWNLGPVVEGLFFTVTDPQTGKKIADFTRWWPEATGTSFQQRNSLVVGFIMGFTVIPIIFTIAEDAFSNVPGALRSGSLALGASRWQTAWRIILPTASAGIFSALMVGLGRAVGETMIVVMATGNTPIMEWNIFSGMRTLSANIAVELPEAPHHSTLYRTLFLGAFVLFMMTFVINTVAEVLRQHLRSRYKTI